MKKYIYYSVVFVLTLIVGAIGGSYVHQSAPVKGTSNVSTISAASLQIGSGCDYSYGSCSATTINQINSGTCYIKAYATTIAASSSATVDCQATAAVSAGGIAPLAGIQYGDNVQSTLATSTAGTTFMGLAIGGASASSTSGYISMRVINLTGATYTWPTSGNATGTAYYVTTR